MVITTMRCLTGECSEPVHVTDFDVNPADTDKVYDILTLFASEGATDVTVETSDARLLGLLVQRPADGDERGKPDYVPPKWRMEETLMFFAFNPN